MDLSGMGPWEMSTVRVSEAIGYSTALATYVLPSRMRWWRYKISLLLDKIQQAYDIEIWYNIAP